MVVADFDSTLRPFSLETSQSSESVLRAQIPRTARVLPDASSLYTSSEAFIVDFAKGEVAGPALLLKATFRLEAYRDGLFERFSIDFPHQLQNAVLKRRAEFFAGRLLSKLAIQHLLGTDEPVGIGAFRQPIWPCGLTGSISHSRGRVASLTSREIGACLGVDVEEICSEAGGEMMRNMVLSSHEEALLRSTRLSFPILATLAFSAKETLFKALFPTVRYYFGFETAAVCEFDFADGRIVLELKTDLSKNFRRGARFDVGFLVENGVAMTWTKIEIS